jgi:hypothetical protein
MHFADKGPSTPSRRGHSALTVTVENLDGLVAAIEGGPSRSQTAPRRRGLRHRIARNERGGTRLSVPGVIAKKFDLQTT